MSSSTKTCWKTTSDVSSAAWNRWVWLLTDGCRIQVSEGRLTKPTWPGRNGMNATPLRDCRAERPSPDQVGGPPQEPPGLVDQVRLQVAPGGRLAQRGRGQAAEQRGDGLVVLGAPDDRAAEGASAAVADLQESRAAPVAAFGRVEGIAPPSGHALRLASAPDSHRRVQVTELLPAGPGGKADRPVHGYAVAGQFANGDQGRRGARPVRITQV